jgi:hypothetical protein
MSQHSWQREAVAKRPKLQIAAEVAIIITALAAIISLLIVIAEKING